LTDDFVTKTTSNPDIEVGKNAFDDFIVGAVSGKVISMPADIKSLYEDVGGDTEKKYIRRKLKEIPPNYDADAKIETLQLMVKRDKLEQDRRGVSSELTTTYDREIDNINQRISAISEEQSGKRTAYEPSDIEQIQNKLNTVEDALIEGDYRRASENMMIGDTRIDQFIRQQKDILDDQTYQNLRNRSNEIAQSIDKIKQGDIQNIPSEKIRNALQEKQQTGETIEQPKVEDVVPQEIQDYAVQQGYTNIHEAINSIRKHVDRNVGPEDITKEQIDEATRLRTEQATPEGLEELKRREQEILNQESIPNAELIELSQIEQEIEEQQGAVRQATEQRLRQATEQQQPDLQRQIDELRTERQRVRRTQEETTREIERQEAAQREQEINRELRQLLSQRQNLLRQQPQQTEEAAEEQPAQQETVTLGEETQATQAMSRRLKSDRERTFTRPIQRGEERIGDVTIEKGDNEWSVKRVDIEQEQQGQGFGKQVYRDLNRQAQQEGAVLRSDRADKINDNAKRLWESLVRDGDAIREEGRYRMKTQEEIETPAEEITQEEMVEPSKRKLGNIRKFVEDYQGDQNVADPSVKTSKRQAQKYIDEHGNWLYENERNLFDNLSGLIEESNSQYEGGIYDTLKERNEKVGTGTQKREEVERDAEEIQAISEEVRTAAEEAGYKTMEDFWRDYKQYGTYTGTPKGSDIVEGDVQSVVTKRRQTERTRQPTEEKTEEPEQNFADNISKTLDDLEDGIVTGQITNIQDAPKIENKSIGQYIIDNKNQMPEQRYEDLRNRYNSIAKSLEQIKQGNIDDIPNAKIKRGIRGDINTYQQAKTKLPKSTKEFLDFAISRLQQRFPNLKVTYDKNLNVPAQFTKDGIKINPDKAGADTPIHEFAHPYVQLMKNYNTELYSVGKRLVREAGITEEVRKDMTKEQKETDEEFEERVTDEAMARVIGEQGAKVAQRKYNRSNLKKIRDFAERLWDWVKKQLGILPKYDVSTLNIEKFGKLIGKDLLNTQPLTQENAGTIIEANIVGDYGSIALDNGALLYSRQGKTNIDKLQGWLARGFRTKAEAPNVVRSIDQYKMGVVRGYTQQLRLDIIDFHNYFRKNYMKSKTDPENPFNGVSRPEIGEKLNGILQENLPLENIDEKLTESQKQAKRFRILQQYGFPEDAQLLEKIMKMRSTVDQLSKELITSGLISDKLAPVLNNNLGIYLTRTYQAHKNENWEPSLDVRLRARSKVRSDFHKGQVDKVDYSWNDQDNIDLEINTVFSGKVKLNNVTKERAKELLDYDQSEDVFTEEDGSFTPNKTVNIGWKIDEQGEYINTRFRKLKDSEIDNMLDQLINSNIQEAMFRGKGKGFSKSPYLGILMQRKAIPDEILEFMGVEKDAYVRLYDSVKKMANLLATHKSLEQLKETGMDKFLWRRKADAPRGVEKISGDKTESYSPLNGLYARPETIRYLKKVDDPKNMNWAMKTIMKFNGIIKGGFTIWNNVTQLRNMLSWVAIHAANGTLNFQDIDKHFKIAIQDMGFYRSQEELKQWHNKLIRLHVLHENADFNDFQDFIQETENKPGRFFSESWLDRMGKVGQAMEKARKAGRSAERFAEQLYRFGDDFNKTIYFFNTLRQYREAKPETPEEDLQREVAEVTIKTTPTYSDLPAVVRALRRFPVTGAFVSWPTAMVKSSVGSFQTAFKEINSGNKKLQRKGYKRLFGGILFSTPIAGMMAQWSSMLLAGMDDDEADKLEPMLAPWNQNTFKFYLPSAESGSYRFIPLSYIDPYNYTNRIFTALLRHPDRSHQPVVEALKEFFKPYVGEDILFKAVGDIYADAKTGKGKIVNPADDMFQQTKDIIAYLLNELKPGVIRNALRLYKASTDQKNVTEYGTRYRMFNEIFSNTTGFRVTENDVRQSMFYKVLEYQDEINNLRKAYRQVKYDPQKSDATVQNEFYNQNKKARQEFKKIKDIVYSSKAQLGLTGDEVTKVLKDAELPEWMIRDLLTGQFSGIYNNPAEKLKEDLQERRKK
jgi:hypothetical protein